MDRKEINWEKLKKRIQYNHNCTLLIPYSIFELDNELNKKKITIPQELYNYLTMVSREMRCFYKSYSYIFQLDEIPDNENTKYNITSNDIPSDIYTGEKDWLNFDTYESDLIQGHVDDFLNSIPTNERIDKEDEIENEIGNISKRISFECKRKLKNFVQINDGGCDSSLVIYLGEGDLYGTIWHCDCANEILLSKKYDNFYDLLVDEYPEIL